MSEFTLTEYVRTQEDNEFYMELAIEGMFCLESIEDSESWKEAHVKCYDKLFPYVKLIMESLAYGGRIIELPLLLK